MSWRNARNHPMCHDPISRETDNHSLRDHLLEKFLTSLLRWLFGGVSNIFQRYFWWNCCDWWIFNLVWNVWKFIPYSSNHFKQEGRVILLFLIIHEFTVFFGGPFLDRYSLSEVTRICSKSFLLKLQHDVETRGTYNGWEAASSTIPGVTTETWAADTDRTWNFLFRLWCYW